MCFFLNFNKNSNIWYCLIFTQITQKGMFLNSGSFVCLRSCETSSVVAQVLFQMENYYILFENERGVLLYIICLYCINRWWKPIATEIRSHPSVCFYCCSGFNVSLLWKLFDAQILNSMIFSRMKIDLNTDV